MKLGAAAFRVSRRSEPLALNGMVATSHAMASSVGLDILRRGGKAADACVAAAAVLNVVEPCSTGIGGDMFALCFDGETKRVSAINGSGRSPSHLTKEVLRAKGLIEGDAISDVTHACTVTVPGTCAGWMDTLERHGNMTAREVLTPAIELARQGVPVAEITAGVWRSHEALLQRLGSDEFLLNGRAPRTGEVFRNPGLAATFERVAEHGARGFYTGEVADAIVACVQQADGVLDHADLKRHASTFEAPIHTTYRGRYRVFECAPNGQGVAALLALNICETFDWKSLSGAEQLHVSIEAMRLAFADVAYHVADPEHATCIDLLLSKEYAAQRAREIQANKASHFERGTAQYASNTVYLCAVDQWGNACSFINSNYKGFGTALVPRGWGFSLQNRGHNFYCGDDVKHPNAVAPEKRTYHTIIPAMITHEATGELMAACGVMGEFMQPQGHLQVMLGLFEEGLTPQQVLEKPRFCVDFQGPNVKVEEEMHPSLMGHLETLGHQLQVLGDDERKWFGRGQIITRDPETKVLTGASDPRSDGLAIGF